jgi:hypothetical protein
MEWLIYALLAVVAVILLKRFLPSPKQFGPATNALLVEHALGLIELVPQNPFATRLKDAVVAVWRAAGFPRSTEEVVRDAFNRADRLVQLNILAMAFNELGHQPMLPNEFWHPVGNPFVSVDPRHIEAVARRLNATHGINVSVRSKPLVMTAWGISDA